MKQVSVVILNWNGKLLLEKYLPSVIANTNTSIADIVVVDNCSTDNSVEFLKQQYPSVAIIEFDKNWGFAEGYNKALALLQTPYFILLNSDVEVTPKWLEPLLSVLTNNKDQVAAVQPKILSEKNKSYFEHAGASGGFIDKYGYPFCRGRIFDTVEIDNSQYNDSIEIFWASGACLAIDAKLYFEVGGLDETFFAHMEEIDLCWRLNARGYKLKCIPQSTIYHVGGATLTENSPQKVFLNFRNNLIMLYKNLPDGVLKKTLRVRLFLDYIAAFQMLINGNKENYKAILKARREFNKLKKTIYKSKRIENLKESITFDISTIYNKSILFDFFIRKKKKYNSLKW